MKKRSRKSKTRTRQDSRGDSKAHTVSRQIIRANKAAESTHLPSGAASASRRTEQFSTLCNSFPESAFLPPILKYSDSRKPLLLLHSVSQRRLKPAQLSKLPPTAYGLAINSPKRPPVDILKLMNKSAHRFLSSCCYFCGEHHHLTRGVVEVAGYAFTVYGHAGCFPLDPSA